MTHRHLWKINAILAVVSVAVVGASCYYVWQVLFGV
jgi:nitrate reductase NapE component